MKVTIMIIIIQKTIYSKKEINIDDLDYFNKKQKELQEIQGVINKFTKTKLNNFKKRRNNK